MNLLEITVRNILNKFGEGNHKPGSGSAAALQGLVACKLISTVITLTLDKKRNHLYGHCLPELIDFQQKIDNEIFPKLSHLFQLDSDQFDKTIRLRVARDEAEDISEKNRFRREALTELKVSIEIPLEISELCIELAEMASYVFDNGFKSARGDSQVGLSAAVSALAGCIAIIRLNVLSFSSHEYEYLKATLDKVDQLEAEHQRLSRNTQLKIDTLKQEYDLKIPLFEGINDILQKYKGKGGINIEECVRELQNLLWKNKHLLWKNNVPKTVLEVLEPKLVFSQCLGYDHFITGKFGVPGDDDEPIEIGGLIDQDNKLVVISNHFSKEVQRFTAAHELGHAILHEQSIMHRDLPVDCIGKRKTRTFEEISADKFASIFLMPGKQVKQAFQQIFSETEFVINENTAFKFGGRNISEIRSECKDVRGLSRKLSTTTIYDNKLFMSLNEIFGVSVEAMAIRIEELGLVKF